MTTATLSSCLYQGLVLHKRHVESVHQFSYKLFMFFFDLDELDQLQKKFRGFFSTTFPSFIWFRNKDYLAAFEADSLKHRVIQCLEHSLKITYEKPLNVKLLTHPRWFGLVMNPLSLFYCYEGDVLRFIIGEITNTPWNERHTYVFEVDPASANRKAVVDKKFEKEFHVSPFLPMAMDYRWLLSSPQERLNVSIWNSVGNRCDFEAHLTLTKLPLSAASLFKAWIKAPWMTATVALGIYWQAFKLYAVKRVTFYDHPREVTPKKGNPL